jgi:hypothetical protein
VGGGERDEGKEMRNEERRGEKMRGRLENLFSSRKGKLYQEGKKWRERAN